MRQLNGTGSVMGDIPSRRLGVEYDPTLVSVDQIRQALQSVGYDSTVA